MAENENRPTLKDLSIQLLELKELYMELARTIPDEKEDELGRFNIAETLACLRKLLTAIYTTKKTAIETQHAAILSENIKTLEYLTKSSECLEDILQKVQLQLPQKQRGKNNQPLSENLIDTYKIFRDGFWLAFRWMKNFKHIANELAGVFLQEQSKITSKENHTIESSDIPPDQNLLNSLRWFHANFWNSIFKNFVTSIYV